MEVEQFLNMCGGATMSQQQACELNRALTCAKASDFSQDQRSKVASYLATALNIDSVEPNLAPSLDALLLSLQDEI